MQKSDWLSVISQRINSFLNEKLYCDCTFVFSDEVDGTDRDTKIQTSPNEVNVVPMNDEETSASAKCMVRCEESTHEERSVVVFGEKHERNNFEKCSKTNNKISKICNEVENQMQIRCHKIILAASSPVFEAMFFGSMSTNQDSINIVDIDYEIFNQMINCIYNNEENLTSLKNSSELYIAADKYLLENIVEKCVNYLKENIRSDNVLEIYEFAKYHNENYLEYLCLKEIHLNTSKILKCETLVNASESTLDMILSKDILNISSEVELITAVDRWAQSECIKKDNSDAKLIATKLIQKLRMLTLNVEEFASLSFDLQIFSDRDMLEIFQRISNRNFKPDLTHNFISKNEVARRKNQEFDFRVKLIPETTTNFKCNGSWCLSLRFSVKSFQNLRGVELQMASSNNNPSKENYRENIEVMIKKTSDENCLSEVNFQENVITSAERQILLEEDLILIPSEVYTIELKLSTIRYYSLCTFNNTYCSDPDMGFMLSSQQSNKPSDIKGNVLRSLIFAETLK